MHFPPAEFLSLSSPTRAPLHQTRSRPPELFTDFSHRKGILLSSHSTGNNISTIFSGNFSQRLISFFSLPVNRLILEIYSHSSHVSFHSTHPTAILSHSQPSPTTVSLFGGDAFTQTWLMPRLLGFNRPSCGASPAEGRRCSTQKVC